MRIKKIIKFFCFIVLLFNISQNYLRPTSENGFVCMAETAENEILSDEDWKIELEENNQKGAKEFDFIQSNLASSDLADNGYFLLILGILLIVISGAGIVFFSICLYKICKNTKKRKANRGKSRK